jgi:fructose-1,6-bisphosphatase/sedoheptulose 1,7-bisphosphatase-like protein
MQVVKTAISIQKPLFEEAENVAQAMNVSRSRLFVIALQDYIDRKKNRELLTQINDACADEPDDSEITLRKKSRSTHRRLVRSEW